MFFLSNIIAALVGGIIAEYSMTLLFIIGGLISIFAAILFHIMIKNKTQLF
jgi:hypothetical protein